MMKWRRTENKKKQKIERKQQVGLYVLLSQRVLLAVEESFIVFSSYFTQTSGLGLVCT